MASQETLEATDLRVRRDLQALQVNPDHQVKQAPMASPDQTAKQVRREAPVSPDHRAPKANPETKDRLANLDQQDQLDLEATKAPTASQDLEDRLVQPVPVAKPVSLERMGRPDHPVNLARTPNTARARNAQARRLLLERRQRHKNGLRTAAEHFLVFAEQSSLVVFAHLLTVSFVTSQMLPSYVALLRNFS